LFQSVQGRFLQVQQTSLAI